MSTETVTFTFTLLVTVEASAERMPAPDTLERDVQRLLEEGTSSKPGSSAVCVNAWGGDIVQGSLLTTRAKECHRSLRRG